MRGGYNEEPRKNQRLPIPSTTAKARVVALINKGSEQ
jgi:hypothetical protein